MGSSIWSSTGAGSGSWEVEELELGPEDEELEEDAPGVPKLPLNDIVDCCILTGLDASTKKILFSKL